MIARAGVVKLADTLALGASAARHEGSSPSSGMKINPPTRMVAGFIFLIRVEGLERAGTSEASVR